MANKKEPTSASLSKLILTVSIIVSLGALFGAVGYLVTHSQKFITSIINQPVEEKITITTDKTEYEQGEDIYWFPKNYKIGELYLLRESCSKTFTTAPELEKNKDGIWQRVSWFDPMFTLCEITYTDCARLKTDFNDIIKTKYIDLNNNKILLDSGIYRIKAEFGKSCLQNTERKKGELKNVFAVYSNEFTVKEKSVQNHGVSIMTDKTEYEFGENISISLKNNSKNQVKYFENFGCGAEIFTNNEWNFLYDKFSCGWGQELMLSAEETKKVDSVFPLEAGKYRLALFYKSEKLLKLEEIGNIVCDNIPADLENSLINGKWVKNEITPKGTCDACGCRATDENVFSVGDASIDATYVSCFGTGYIINYKGKKFNCYSEKFKNYIKQAYPSPSDDWDKIYSPEFTVKEKTSEILTIDYILKHSEELTNKNISTEGIANNNENKIVCAKGPGCNKCDSPLMLEENGQSIEISNRLINTVIMCTGTDCEGIKECRPLAKGKSYTVTGIWNGRSLDIKSWVEKTAIDSRCNVSFGAGDRTETCMAYFEGSVFNSVSKKCTIVKGSGCTSPPFKTLEECQKVCETGIISGNELKFETIKNNNSIWWIGKEKNYVIKNQSNWQKLWDGDANSIPYIDFNKDMVIAVSEIVLTGGHNFQITKIIEEQNKIAVLVRVTKPGSGCIVTQATEELLHIVKVQKSDKEVIFKTEKVVTNCQE